MVLPPARARSSCRYILLAGFFGFVACELAASPDVNILRSALNWLGGISKRARWVESWDGWSGGIATQSGTHVTPDNALEWVFDAVQVRSQTLAALPLKLFQREGENGDKSPATDEPLYRLLHDQPHPDLTSYEFRNLQNSMLDLRGNCYAQIVRDNSGGVRRLVPLHPDRVTPRRLERYTADGLRPIVYDVYNDGFGPGGGMRTLDASDMLHIRGFTTDGLLGISPISIKAETLGLAMAAYRHGSKMFANGAKPGGVLEHPAKLGEEGRKNLRASWQAVHGGPDNTGKTAILEEGMKYHEIGLSNEDAQLLESRQYSRTEIASMYRVPPHMIGDLSRATFSNIEQQGIDFVTHCMLPIITNWEQRMNVSLLSKDEQQEFYFKFNVAGLLRGDLASRYSAYRIGLGRAGEPGWITVNDIRETEDMNSMEGGDKLFSGIAPDLGVKARSAIEPVLVHTLGRAFRKEAKAVRAILKKNDAAELDRFYGDHRRYLLEELAPVFVSARALGVTLPSAEAIADGEIRSSQRLLVNGTPTTSEETLVTFETTRAATASAEILKAV